MIQRVASEDLNKVKVVTGIEQPLLGKHNSIAKAWPLYTTNHVLKDEGTFKFLFHNRSDKSVAFIRTVPQFLLGMKSTTRCGLKQNAGSIKFLFNPCCAYQSPSAQSKVSGLEHCHFKTRHPS